MGRPGLKLSSKEDSRGAAMQSLVVALLAVALAAANIVPAQERQVVQDRVEETKETSSENDKTSSGCLNCNWGPPLNANDKENAHKLTMLKAHTSPPNMTAAAWAMMNGWIDSDPETKIPYKPRIINAKLSRRWPSGVVPYTIENTFSADHRAVIQAGIDDITAKTCVTFREKVSTDEDWMEIISTGASGCSANAAYYGPGHGAHSVKLMLNGCVHISVVIHELLHILSVSHEQQRPDRDTYVDMHWLNIQVDKASNMWRFASMDEDFDSLEKCSDDGKTDPEDFSNCVNPSAQVDDFGISYDYTSVMHYGLTSFAVVSGTNVMTPKGGYSGAIGGDIMSAADITRLQRAYSCKESAPYDYNGCGGFRYSETGDSINGNCDCNGACEWILKTDPDKGITLTFDSFNIPGDCSTEYLEIRGGTQDDGPVIGKYCFDNPPTSFDTKHNSLYIKFVKPSGSTSGFQATWTTSPMTCCPKIIFEDSGWSSGGFTREDGVTHNGYPVYKKDDTFNGEVYYMVACPKYNKWIIAGADYTSGSGCSYYQYIEDGGTYCPENTLGTWKSSSGTEIPDAKVRCSDCDLYPAEIECVTCCNKVTLVGTHSDWLATGFYTGNFAGFTANGNTVNGMPEYVSDSNAAYCLWLNTNPSWTIGSCSSSGGSSGFAWGKGPAGMKCPEQANDWSFFSQNGLGTVDDAGMKANCAVSCSDDPPSTPQGASSDWDSSTKVGGTVVTYTCASGGEVQAICDAATVAWKPTSISCDAAPPPPPAPPATPAPTTGTTKGSKPGGGKKKAPKKPKKKKGGKKGKKPTGGKKKAPKKKKGGKKGKKGKGGKKGR